MRKCICKKCCGVFYENDSNPAVHYSTPATECRACETYRKTPSGNYYQNEKGDYILKEPTQ